MKALVVYESKYGNTEKIAGAIAGSILGDVKVMRSAEAGTALAGIDLLIVGAPTHGGKPMPEMQMFLDHLPESSLKGVKTAAFDTRLKWKFLGRFGFAAGAIAAVLQAKGGSQIVPPEGFVVKRSKGPLMDGELERAAEWGRTIYTKAAL